MSAEPRARQSHPKDRSKAEDRQRLLIFGARKWQPSYRVAPLANRPKDDTVVLLGDRKGIGRSLGGYPTRWPLSDRPMPSRNTVTFLPSIGRERGGS